MRLMGNGRLVTRDDAMPYLENGCVAMSGDRIVEVGETALLQAKYPDADFLDAKGGVIMPGMINAHHHIYSAFARGLAIKDNRTRNFLEILDNLWWTIDRELTLEDTRLSAEATFIDCIENGVTTIFDHHASYGSIEGSLFTIADAARKYGVRANLCYEISDRDGADKMRAAVKENVDFIRYAEKDADDALKGVMGLHAQFTLKDETLDYCASQNPAGAGYHVHVDEGIEDTLMCLKEHGKRPAFRLHDFGILGKKTLCGHCTHASASEIDLIYETGSMVAHNPESNMGNAIGCPPVLKMFEKGILIGLGTDGYTSDMLESYKVANLLHKHHLSDPTVAWSEIPAMLFHNNREMAARFFERPIGILAPGAHADVVVMDYDPLTPMHAGNINSHVLFGMNGRMTATTVIGGELKMKDHQLIGVDKQAVMAHCREQAQDLAGRINAGR
ncbi:MAG: putative aminohydrolase SsnA [Clostridia bacterium]